ncbi:MAG TPA: hypothetical protein VN223_01855 [Candidatus Elarobacter sp.]|nr:hypothetical protein [Candidatus Elarobacter sp.]
MAKLLKVLSTAILGGALALAQANNTGSNQTTTPGNGQPGTGNVPGTGAGQGTGSDIKTTPTTTGKTKKSKSHKAGKKGKKSAHPSNAGTEGGTPK